ncbi:helix-turn-helix domain-containing protein [Bacillus salitolerans]|uniref:Helix-turn-helix domain-containing protein n=1 Tax=Bacillus salitolerans TaxID=1437434 RepID=A0ABW4LKY7_9BACI
MTFQVRVDDSPVYELILSFALYKRPSNIKYLDVGSKWIDHVNNQISPSLRKKLEEKDDIAFIDVACILLEQCPNRDSIEAFLEWLKKPSSGELYELLCPLLVECDTKYLLNIENSRTEFLELIHEWNEQYFKHFPHRLLSERVNSANRLKADLNDSDASVAVVIEKYATGLRIEREDINEVILLPAYHFRPLHTFSFFKDKLFIWYPIRNTGMEEDELLKILKGMADSKRLQILKFLSKEKATFTDVQKEIGGAKGNAHHHLMILRSAGLIRVHLTNEQTYFSTRLCFPDTVKEQLLSFLK